MGAYEIIACRKASSSAQPKYGVLPALTFGVHYDICTLNHGNFIYTLLNKTK